MSYLAGMSSTQIWLPAIILGGILPDIDFLFLFHPAFNQIHRMFTHNLLFVIFMSVMIGVWAKKRPKKWIIFSLLMGGILGGISTGQDIVVRCAVKPTSSILTTRKTITKSGEDTEIITKGRHDPCVGIRAVPVGEAMTACVLLDHLLLHRGQVGANQGKIGE